MSISAVATYLSRVTTRFDTADIPDLTGKVAIVTGGNSGIGFHTVQELSKKGAKVYLAARNEKKALNAIVRMKREGGLGTGSVEWLELDLSTPRKAQISANEFLTKESRLDMLICNAGVLAETYSFVQEAGYDISHSMSTNHLGHFVFTQTLYPILKHTAFLPNADVRIVVVASEAHRAVLFAPKFSSLDGWNVSGDWALARVYRAGLSKLANILFARELQSRLDKDQTPITVLAIHPGEFASEGFAKGLLDSFPWPLSLLILALVRFVSVLLGGRTAFFMTPKEGSYTSLHAATSKVIQVHRDVYKGAYLNPYDKLAKPSRLAQSDKLAKELWEFSERLANKCLGLSSQTL